uniref:phosphoethanolamine transferase n=1 Tax=Alistipes shahii TaxID=328814 RepID=UPI00267746F4|nr:phosphoethanolamine transferase [Alistipes shahii]
MQRSATSCFAKHIAAFLVRPFGEYPAFLVLTALLPLVPDIIRFFLNEMSFVPGRNLFYGTLLSLFRAWLLVLPLCLRQHDRGGEILAVRIAEAIYRVFVLSCLGLLSLAESFLLIRFGTPFSFSVIQLLWETDGRESLEFLKTYCTTPAFLLPAAACVLLTAGYLLAEHRKIRFELHSRKVRISLLFLLAGSGAFYVSRLHFQYALTRTGDFPGEMMRQTATLTPFERLHTSLFWFRHEFSAENAEQLLRTLESVEIESCSFRSPCIVIIIGESFSKHHSSLYGYPLPTNPRLEERLRRGELFVFRDVVSPANLTTSVLSNLFSPASLGSGQSWKDSPLFPALFKKAGYTTCHLDNQAAGNDYDYHDLGLKALFNARSTPLLFTVHNENRHPYDLELLDDYDRLTSRDDTPELVVFHLMGQHVSYSDRYPTEEAYFTPGDIRREDLTQQERQVVADYDNATRYNDQVVDAILARFIDRDAIAVYLSDHGEEVYDYRDFFCRSHDLPLTPEVCKYQFEIPFMIWMSDTYRRNRPDVAAQVAGALDRPFSADDLSHLLLDLAGIRCRWYDPARSLIGERFDTTRPRPLLMGFEPAGNYETIIGRDRKQ